MRPPKSVLEQTAGKSPHRAMRRAMQMLFPDRPIDLNENPDGTFSARPRGTKLTKTTKGTNT